jgi:hypothetical protein
MIGKKKNILWFFVNDSNDLREMEQRGLVFFYGMFVE